VTIVRAGGEHHVTPRRRSSGADSPCTYGTVVLDLSDPATLAEFPDAIAVFGDRPEGATHGYHLYCSGAYISSSWINPAEVVDLDAMAGSEAQRYIEDVLVPNVELGINPTNDGITGFESWFWIDGFDGTVTGPPITALGMVIDVRMSTGSVEWHFGDGTVVTGDLGRAYPEESTVRHTYQHKSVTSGDPERTYTVQAVISLVPEYRVDGGPWITLPRLATTATAPYRVREVQATVDG
jgi:hypothetical protein